MKIFLFFSDKSLIFIFFQFFTNSFDHIKPLDRKLKYNVAEFKIYTNDIQQHSILWAEGE